MAKSNSTLIKEYTETYMEELRDEQEYYIPSFSIEGMTVKGEVFLDGKDRYIHIYYDSVRAEEERGEIKRSIAELEKELRTKKVKGEELLCPTRYEKYFFITLNKDKTIKDFSQNKEYIINLKRHVGFFVIITSQKMSAEEALEKYRSRNLIEVMFKSLKSFMGMNKARVHTDKASLSTYGLAFIASIVRSEFERVTKPIIKGTSDSVITLFEELDKITATLSLNGKHYTRRYALTQRQKQILTLFNITEKTIDSLLEKLAPHECQL